MKNLIKRLERQRIVTNQQSTDVSAAAQNLIGMFNVPYHAMKPEQLEFDARDEFVDAYEQEVLKVNGFYVTKQNEIETRLSGAYSSLMELVITFKQAKRQQQTLSQERLHSLVEIYRTERAECERDCQSTTKMFLFAQQNVTAFRKIAKKYNRRIHPGASIWLALFVEKYQFYTANMDTLLTAIRYVCSKYSTFLFENNNW